MLSDSVTARRAGLFAIVGFSFLTCGMMWPEVRHISNSAVPHQDIYFNMWRLQWVAHALATSPANLFNGNIFYPEPRTLLFSDALLVEGFTAAPLIWLGVAPVLVHNLMLLGAIVFSAAAMFALVFHLTRSRGAGLLAGIIFGFAPYRFEHIMHMELQWTMWIPLAFLALHRTIEKGRLRYGLATGAALVFQVLSSVYYGIFLAPLLAAGGVLLQIGEGWGAVRRAIVPLAAGAALAVVVTGLYAWPYLHARDRVGERSVEEIRVYAARPADYLVVPPANWLYGRFEQRQGEPERRLFPGALALVLGVVALLLRNPTRTVVVYVVVGVAAFEASLGFRGYSYNFLHEHVGAFRALRAPARLAIFVVFSLAVLSGFGYTFLVAALRARARLIVLLLFAIVLLAEYFSIVPLAKYPNTAAPVYRLLATQPAGVVAEFPMPLVDGLPGQDPKYAYLSMFHWKPIVNGYSGFYPPTYLRRLQDLRGFPDPFSLRALRRDGVRYVVVHETGYTDREAYEHVLSTLDAAEGVRSLGPFSDGEGPATVYEIR